MKNCECLTKVLEQVKEKTGDPEGTISMVFFMSGEARPRIPYTYRKKKKSGEFHSKETEASMIPSYCPWCGVKYETK